MLLRYDNIIKDVCALRHMEISNGHINILAKKSRVDKALNKKTRLNPSRTKALVRAVCLETR